MKPMFPAFSRDSRIVLEKERVSQKAQMHWIATFPHRGSGGGDHFPPTLPPGWPSLWGSLSGKGLCRSSKIQEDLMRPRLPWWLKQLPCSRPKFDPWVGKIPLEKRMATHSSILAWRIPWTEEHGRLCIQRGHKD